MSVITEVFEKLNQHERIVFDGADIIAQIPDVMRKAAVLDRPSDVRLLVITDNLTGNTMERAAITNHGHPENEQSLVDFNGENGIMIMPAGDSPYEQLKNAQEVIDALNGRKITPDFIYAMISAKGAPLHAAVKEIYGPVTGREGVEAQVGRFVPASVMQPDGTAKTIGPDVHNNYAMGMRAPTREEVYRLHFDTVLPATIMGAEYKEKIEFWDMNNAMKGRKIYLRGPNTASEKLDPQVVVQDEIYLVVDSASQNSKPLKKIVAESIFDVSKAMTLRLNAEGRVLSVATPLPHGETPAPQPVPAPIV